MFEITGRQFKALQEIAKIGKKSKCGELAASVFISDGKLIVTDSRILVCIEDDQLKTLPDHSYTGVLSAKVKVSDRIRFDPENDRILIGDKTGKTWNDYVCLPGSFNANAYHKRMVDLFDTAAAQPVFDADVTKCAIDPKYLAVVGGVFQDFGVKSAMTLRRALGTTSGGCAPVPLFTFDSYREVSYGKQPGFHVHAQAMGINEHFEKE